MEASSDRVPRALLAAGCAAAYLWTLCPTVPPGDSGEYAAVACALGVAHPPGYPLHTLLGHLFTWLPFGSPALRVNLSSAVYGLGAALVLFSILRRWTGDGWAAFLGAGLFAFSAPVWRFAVVAEVFTLNALFAALLVAWLLWLARSPADGLRATGAAALTLGLGLSHHHTLVLAAAPLGLGLLLLLVPRMRCGGAGLAARAAAAGGGLFLLGLAPHLYLPWASARRLVVSWGDLTTPGGFATHLLRREYGTLRLVIGEGRSSLADNLGRYALDAGESLLWIGAGLVLWGAVAGWRDGRALRIFCLSLIGAWGGTTLIFGALANLDLSTPLAREAQSRFWQLPNLFLCLLAGRGAAALAARLGPRRRLALPVLALLLVGTQAAVNYPRADRAATRLGEDLARATLASLPPGALFFVRGDTSVNAVRYLQACEGLRADVAAVPLALLETPWIRGVLERARPDVRLPPGPGAPGFGALVDANRERDTFVSVGLPEQVREISGRYELWNVGFTYWLRPAGQRPDAAAYRRASAVYAAFEPPDARARGLSAWERHLVEQYWKREVDRAERLSLAPVDDESGRELVRLAAEALERLVVRAPDPPLSAWRTLAFAWSKLRPSDPRAAARMVAALRRYLELRPDAPDRAQVEALIGG